ncbi:MAG: hypothetical protein CMJ76_10620 [Planctomycetaceae bacterium]|nr:hypothetical protein [Planctomycetaceae bacterium]
MKLLITLTLAFLTPLTAIGQTGDSIEAIKKAGGQVRNVRGGYEVSFNLGKRSLNDQDLAYVAALDSVVVLNLKRTNVSNQNLRHVGEITSLKKLHLELTQIDDTGLQYLSKLDQLNYLNLFGTNVTDESISTLKQLDSLTHLYVWKTKITLQAMETLRESKPDLKIVFGVDLSMIEIPDPNAPTETPKTQLKFITNPNAADAPRSGNGENIEVLFENKSRRKVKLVWVGYDGKLKPYGEIEPGATRIQNSYENNTWLITDTADNALGYFICGDQRALAIIPQ